MTDAAPQDDPAALDGSASSGEPASSDDVASGPGLRRVVLDPDALANLEEQRAFFARSLADLEREHEAGDVDDDDFATLAADYRARLDAVSAALEGGEAIFAEVPRGSRARSILIGAAVALFALACGIGVAQVAGRRGANDEISGSITGGGSRSEIAECYSAWFTDGDLAASQRCFEDVAASDPSNLEARTYAAAVPIMQGDPSQQAFLANLVPLIEVVQADPTYGDPHAFLAVAWMKLGEQENAAKELALFDTRTSSAIAAQFATQVRSALGGGSLAPGGTAPTGP